MRVKQSRILAWVLLLGVALTAFCAVSPVDVRGQETSRTGTVSEEPRPATDSPGDVAPRGAVRAYLEAARAGEYGEAARYLDLSLIIPEEHMTKGPTLARQLRAVLERTLWIDLQTLSRDPKGNLQDGLAPDLDRVGTIEIEHSDVGRSRRAMT